MSDFVARYLNLEAQAVEAERKAGFLKYGTTLKWLMTEKGLENPAEYLDYVHPKNLDQFLEKNEALPKLLESIPLKKAILTNSPRFHAQRVLDFFGISGFFTYISDLGNNNLLGKPHREAYTRILTHLGWPAKETLFIDDVPSYLEGFAALGGSCLHVDAFNPTVKGSFTKVSSILDLPKVLIS